jgi:hypothetical protein
VVALIKFQFIPLSNLFLSNSKNSINIGHCECFFFFLF